MRREAGGLLVPLMHVMATEAAFFFSVYFYFGLSFLKVKPPYQHGHQPAASKCLFVFALLLLSTAPYLFCSSLKWRGGGARPGFSSARFLCAAQRAGIRKPEENGGQRGRAGKRGEMKRLESVKVN